jgi:2-iminobutanoate/2-iminopropanoate deaminase
MSSLVKIETSQAPKALGPYSQAIHSGSLLFVSGQLPVDPQTGQLTETNIRIQTQQVLKNLQAVLEAGRCSIQQVVRTDVFLKDLNDFAAFNEEYGKVFSHSPAPARQTVQVARIPLDALVEISCIASLS